MIDGHTGIEPRWGAVDYNSDPRRDGRRPERAAGTRNQQAVHDLVFVRQLRYSHAARIMGISPSRVAAIARRAGERTRDGVFLARRSDLAQPGFIAQHGAVADAIVEWAAS